MDLEAPDQISEDRVLLFQLFDESKRCERWRLRFRALGVFRMTGKKVEFSVSSVNQDQRQL